MSEEISDISEEEILRDQSIRILLVRGSLTIIGGLVFLFWPGVTMNLVAVLLGVFLLGDSLSSLYLLYKRSGFSQLSAWTPKALQILLATLFILRPQGIVKLGVSFLFVLAGASLVMGIFISLMSKEPSQRKIGLSGGLLLAMGLVLIFAPFLTAQFFVRLIGGVTILLSVRDIRKLLLLWKTPIRQSE